MTLVVKQLVRKAKNKAGRNNQGRIVCRFRGNRLVKKMIFINYFRRVFDQIGVVIKIIKNSLQSGFVCLVFYKHSGLFEYILSSQGLSSGCFIR